MEDLGISYSSEFTLGYDALPFHPVVAHQESSVLQVPIHPVSIGNFLRVKAGAATMKEYFRWQIARNVALNDPSIFYHHPTHEHWDVLADMFTDINDRGIAKYSFGEYSAWWKRREEVVYECRYEQGVITTRWEINYPDVLLRVHTQKGTEGFISNVESAEIDEIPVVLKSETTPTVDNNRLQSLRKIAPRLLRYTYEDFMVRLER